MTSLEDLKKLGDSSLLVKEDWILLKYIATTEQNTFRPCLCTNPNKHGSILFTKDSLKTYSNPKHSAYGLGSVYNRFKCSAAGCNNSFAPVTMLLKYKESQEAPLINPSTKKRLHSQQHESSTSNREPKAFLWSDVVDDIEMSQLESPNSQLNTQLQDTNSYPTSSTSESHHATTNVSYPTTTSNESHHATTNDENINSEQSITILHTLNPNSSNELSLKIDKLTDIIISMKSDADKKINFLLDSFGKLLTHNQALENKIKDLTTRLQTTEDNFTLSNPNLNPTLQKSVKQAIQSPADYLILPTSLVDSTSKHNDSTTNSWASIARSSPENQSILAKSKAKETIQNTNRAHLLSCLSKVAKNRSNQTINTTSIYVGGFEYLKIREIWKAIYEARFQTSRIINIQWIGKTVLDIVVTSDYHLQFVSELSLNKRFRILTFNPSYNKNAQSTEHSESAMRSFSVRCIKNILNPSNSLICINHFKILSEQYCQQNPDLNKIFTEEWNRAKEAFSLKIETIATKITTASQKLQTEFNEDVEKEMKLDQDILKKLNPEHPALLCKTHPMHESNMTLSNHIETDTEMAIDSILTTADSDMDAITESSITTAASTKEDGSGAH